MPSGSQPESGSQPFYGAEIRGGASIPLLHIRMCISGSRSRIGIPDHQNIQSPSSRSFRWEEETGEVRDGSLPSANCVVGGTRFGR